MCEPVTLSAFAAGVLPTVGGLTNVAAAGSIFTLSNALIAGTALSTGLSAFGQIQAGRDASARAAFQAKVAKRNQAIAALAAADAEDRGREEVRRVALATRQIQGQQRVGLAAAGQQVGTGSALDIISDTAALGKLDERIVRANAEREAMSLRLRGDDFGFEAVLARRRSASALSTGFFNAGRTALTGAVKVGRLIRNT